MGGTGGGAEAAGRPARGTPADGARAPRAGGAKGGGEGGDARGVGGVRGGADHAPVGAGDLRPPKRGEVQTNRTMYEKRINRM